MHGKRKIINSFGVTDRTVVGWPATLSCVLVCTLGPVGEAHVFHTHSYVRNVALWLAGRL
jgi:hypothetical protein